MNKTLLLSILLLLTACDSHQTVNGIVTDKVSGIPLQGITIEHKNRSGTTKTDSLGRFEITQLSSGFKPEPIILVIKEENYIQQELTVSVKNRDTLKIELVRK